MTMRVLVVDDNETNLHLLVYLLKCSGYVVDGFTSPRAALDALQEQVYNFALVDMLMPDIDGFEFASRIRSERHTRWLPLIAITALAMVGDRERILGAGFDGYIPKPIDPERFIAQLLGFVSKSVRRRARIQRGEPAGESEGDGTLVLVVDDVVVNRQVIRGTLAPFGYRIAEAGNANAAIAEIESERPALILCDVHMPVADGFELVERIKGDDRWRDIPFIFISSTAWQTRERRRAMELGADKFILRPIDPPKLLEEVRSAIGQL